MGIPRADAPILPRLGPTPPDSGLRIPGQYVWCSSVIHADGRWHMFSAAWPERPDPRRYSRRGILQGYLQESVVVRAEADVPVGPYHLRETVLTPRGGDHWDVVCCHNPNIVHYGDGFVLFFQTCGHPGESRRIGYVTSDRITGPWQHAPAALPFEGDAVNPAVWVEPDGSLLMAFRSHPMRLAVARAPALEGPWTVLNSDCLPYYGLEDPFLFHWRGQYHIVIEDAFMQVTGDMRNGIRLVSNDARKWSFYEPEIRAYGPHIEWSNGTSVLPVRRERPFLILQDGEPTHLVNGVLFSDGETYDARSIVVPLLD